MYKPTNAHSAIRVVYYQYLHVTVISLTIFRVYSINIRNIIQVEYNEILQHLVHCKNSINS